jgi:hypothetical protein
MVGAMHDAESKVAKLTYLHQEILALRTSSGGVASVIIAGDILYGGLCVCTRIA